VTFGSNKQAFVVWIVLAQRVMHEGWYIQLMNAIARKLLGQAPKTSAVSEWKKNYRREKPKIAALLSMAKAGSHFILHKLQGHPAVLSLEERALSRELKNYFNFQNTRIEDLVKQQLLPRKNSLENIQWIVLNKPRITDVTYHFPYQRQNIRLIHLVRNPITLYFGWKRGWGEMARRDYGGQMPSSEAMLDWLGRMLLTEMSAYAYWNSPSDLVLNLESFACKTNENLKTLYALMEIEPIGEEQLTVLTHCDQCGMELVKQIVETKNGSQEALVCPRCKREYFAAGGYNYIRKVLPGDLSTWKNNPESDEALSYFENLFGKDFLEYWVAEHYLQSSGIRVFRDRYADLLKKLVA
jgi:hypothetical protein